MAQLAIKVFTMTVKTASKPLAYLFQDYMLSHPGVRQNAIDAAQVLHRWNVRLNRANRGQKKKTEISPLNDERALNLAGKFFSETFIYAVGGGLLWYEYDRGIRRDEQKKVEKEKRRLEKEVRMRRRFEHQMEMIGDLELRHREVLGRLEELESRVGVSSNPGGGDSTAPRRFFGLF
ncbi:OPA3-like protein [Chloropicon roscoffensis]|uniref:OPA3-like protein n=1 Tax=Chloropicon roscoffensis TaxID=1461544 RepID=A0AAX4P9U1_9CHLO